MTPEAEQKRDKQLRNIEKRLKRMRETLILMMLTQFAIVVLIIIPAMTP